MGSDIFYAYFDMIFNVNQIKYVYVCVFPFASGSALSTCLRAQTPHWNGFNSLPMFSFSTIIPKDSLTTAQDLP